MLDETERVAEMIGREGELLVVDAFLERAGAGFSALALEGEAGIGKTTVWLAALQRAEARGFRVLSCRPAKTETKLALSAVADLLERVPESAFDALPARQRQAIEVVLMRTGVAERPPPPRVLATAIRSMLADLTRDGLLVAVDDVQWIDRASAGVLAFALRRLGDMRMGWLFARRLGEASSFDLQPLVAPDSLMLATIGPLPLAILHRVIEQRLSGSLSRAALVQVHQVSGGNPFYAIEIGRELLRVNDPLRVGVSVPGDLRRLLVGRVLRLPVSTRQALLTAAALSHPTTTLVDEEALSAAEEADLVHVNAQGQITFRHPLLASALYETASAAVRRQLHRQLAERLTDTEERARHLAIATLTPDEEVAKLLETGAVAARHRGAWDSAAWLLEQAYSLTPPERLGDASRRIIAAAEHHAPAGDRPRARHLLEELLVKRPGPPWSPRALRLLADVVRNDEDFIEAKRLLEQALRCAEEPGLVVTIELGLAIVHAVLQDYPSGLAHASRGLQRAEALGDGALTAEALASYFDLKKSQSIAL